MIVSLSGTPGAGKTAAASLLDPEDFLIISMDVLSEKYISGVDTARGSKEIDTDALARDMKNGKIEELNHGNRYVIIEGHLSHHLPADLIIVLRASTRCIRERLQYQGYLRGKIVENMEAEALGIITLEALDSGPPVYEIDTTNRTPEEVASRIREIIVFQPQPIAIPEQMIDFSGEIMEWY